MIHQSSLSRSPVALIVFFLFMTASRSNPQSTASQSAGATQPVQSKFRLTRSISGSRDTNRAADL